MNIPRGHRSQSPEVMRSNNWHLDKQGQLYMTGHEMASEEMPPHMAGKAHGLIQFQTLYRHLQL